MHAQSAETSRESGNGLGPEDDELVERLRGAGLRATDSRLRILRVLQQVRTQRLCAEEVVKALIGAGGRISVATIYRLLLELEQRGVLVREWLRGGKAIYWLRPSSGAGPRYRITCRDCSREIAAESDGLQQILGQLAGSGDFVFVDQPITVQVTCRDCAARKPATVAALSRAL